MPFCSPDSDHIERRARIERAFRSTMPNLRTRRQKAWVERAVSLLMLVDSSGPGSPPPGFRAIGRDATRQELERIAELAQQTAAMFSEGERSHLMRTLEAHIAGLHQPAIIALADAGLLIRSRPYLPRAERIAQAAHDALAGLRKVELRVKAGKPSDVRARAVAAILAAYWRYIVQRRPGYSTDPLTGRRGGPFHRLVAGVFAALGLNVDAAHYVRIAVKAAKRRRKSQPIDPPA
jgi:hypothetical protein